MALETSLIFVSSSELCVSILKQHGAKFRSRKVLLVETGSYVRYIIHSGKIEVGVFTSLVTYVGFSDRSVSAPNALYL